MYMPIVLGPDPIMVLCPKCNQNTLTRLKYVNEASKLPRECTHFITTDYIFGWLR
uniref:Uncharacterized protein n=1 Tax=Meloidogyne enterolobii TaxID=390850 RepID=A0A6V7X909_MELEN|nr:unnamed protein product [Meloidogyne enterolobii]